MNIYTKLREAVERSVLGGTIEVVSEGTNCTVSYNNKTLSPYLLLAELKKLEEEENKPKSSCCGATTFEDSVLTIQGPMILLKCQKCQKPCDHDRHVCGVLSESARACKDCSKFMPPLTKEEKDYYEGLRPKKTKGQGGPDELWRQFFVWIKDESDDSMSYWALKDGYEPMDVVAEARKKALNECRLMIARSMDEERYGDAIAFGMDMVNKLDEKMK
jgi:hypothetical protein